MQEKGGTIRGMDTETSQEVWALEATSCSFASVRAVGEDLLAVPQEGCVGLFRPDEDPRAPVAVLVERFDIEPFPDFSAK